MYGSVFRFRTVLTCAVSLGSVAGFFACAPAPSSEVGGPSGGGAVSGTGNGGSSSGGSTAVGGSGFGVGGDIFGFGAAGGEGNATDGGCVESPSQAENVETEITHEVTHDVTTYSPLDIFIMYDQSGSMTGDTPVGSKWDAAKNALIGFVNDPASADIGVGIAYFPLAAPPCNAAGPDCLCLGIAPLCFGYVQLGGGSCAPADYAVPDVGIQLLPGVAQQITDSLNNHSPGGGTPTYPALEGAHIYAKQWAIDHPDRTTIVVLATDGEPNDCNSNIQNVSAVADAAFQGTPSVKTGVIGVGSSLTSLHAVAAAGGTTQAIIVDDQSGDPTQKFIDAMNQLRDSVTTSTTETITETITESVPVPCEWLIPEMPAGITFRQDEVNVKFKAGADGAEQVVGHVADAAACANVDGGWYYDADPPTRVLVCEQTCTTIQSVPDARVNVVFGCETEEAIPR